MKPLIRTLAILGFAAAMLSWTGPASAQQACASHDEVTMQLETQFDEMIIGRGLASAGKRMLELFVSEKGSWTLMISEPNGRSCVLGSGESWHQLPLLVGDPA